MKTQAIAIALMLLPATVYAAEDTTLRELCIVYHAEACLYRHALREVSIMTPVDEAISNALYICGTQLEELNRDLTIRPFRSVYTDAYDRLKPKPEMTNILSHFLSFLSDIFRLRQMR